jgi:hypothetical protein
VNARDEMSAATAETAPLTEDMLAMDVAETLRRTPGLAEGDAAALPGRLRELYRQFGLELADGALGAGIAAAADGRFVHVPPKPGLGLALAHFYIERGTWRPIVVAVGLMLAIGLGGYFLVYRPYHQWQLEQAQQDLTEAMPARMDALYQAIFTITKVQQASNDAADIVARGKAAAKAGDRPGAEAALADLATIRDTLQQDYQLRVVDRAGAKWGFWSFPQYNSDATNYYLIVEAIDAQGNALALPIRSEDTGKTETVSTWGLRVPEEIYRAVEADKDDDGTIEHSLVAIKEFGFLDDNYLVQVLGGTVTRW